MKTKFLSLLVMTGALMSAQTKKVLFIGIDGCRPDVIMSSNTPNIQGLLPTAVYSLDAITLAPTISGNGWSSMLTGVGLDKHNVPDNNFTNPNYANYRDFLTRIESYNSNLRTISLAHWAPINNNIINSADVKTNFSTDLAVKNAAVNALQNDNPDVLFVDFDDVDGAGHSYGFSSAVPQYVNSIQLTDTYIGEILTAMKNRSTYNNENWLVVVTTDHGGEGASHGGGNLTERDIFSIYSNPSFAPQQISKTQSQNTPTYNRLNFPAGTYAKPSVQSSFNFGANQDFTIEFWVKPNANYTSDPVLIGNKNWNNGSNKGFVISGYSGQTFKMNIGDGSNRLDLIGGKLITNQWKHIAVTFDRDGLATMYDDGVPVTVGKMNTIGDITSNLPLTINQDGTNTYGVNLAASYKDVRIWNAKLSNEAIVQWANQDITSSHPFYSQLLANYKMTEASGNTLTDSGPLGNNATIIGSPTRNLQTSETFTIQNYLNTPRQTDHFPTVLNWLCIPVMTAWGIDGINRIPACDTAVLSVNNTDKKQNKLVIYPNPASDEINLKFNSSDKKLILNIIDARGAVVSIKELSSSNSQYNQKIKTDTLPAGVYFVQIKGDATSFSKSFIKR
ncbi:alkaline phosphatase family protein [Chryseobacterium limigenitum]|uniref:Por secretion system C-terminal sorting domain-containing protein n=1 Tax=Chryseobacterium limigenitum TaxID=1612149 RepID=A0A1K2IXM2_9FLAO|nr:alkaline phosphatase family protein [Chryseobacterium limigenitum]SFZ97026.1 Por secretion system C-terminal sorting domain-containing protein [Chryseobacterium limigenitum]